MLMRDLIIFLPELTLFIGAMGLLMRHDMRWYDSSRLVNWGAIILVSAAAVIALVYMTSANLFLMVRCRLMDLPIR